MTNDVFDSPALPLLLALEARGVRVELTRDRLIVEPASSLTAEERAAVLAHGAALAALLRICDADVQDRRTVFAQQLAATQSPGVPAFLFRPGISYQAGTCFSCCDPLPEPRFGRCWRCSIAWRLACRLPVPTPLADALDSARYA